MRQVRHPASKSRDALESAVEDALVPGVFIDWRGCSSSFAELGSVTDEITLRARSPCAIAPILR